jgi:hypothetical protein
VASKVTKPTNPYLAALYGASFIAPFATLNAIVVNKIEPLFSIIRPTERTSYLEYLLLLVSLALIPFGGAVAVRPLLQQRAEGKKKFYIINLLVAAALFLFFIIVTENLGTEIYRCDILQIPNCD